MLWLRADAHRLPLRAETVACVVTSPPYFRQRTYGTSAQELGRGGLEDYVYEIVYAFREVRRVLRAEGLAWLNVGDTAAVSGGPGNDYYRTAGTKYGRPLYSGSAGASGLPALNWCLVPARLALALQDDGWLVRKLVTWDKGRTKRESLAHARRPGTQQETILMLAKTRAHRFFYERLEEPGDVWHFSPVTGPRKHDAPFPAELARRCLLVSSEPGDVVLDPFAGSGTTAAAAAASGRFGVSCDLYAGTSEEERFDGLRVAVDGRPGAR